MAVEWQTITVDPRLHPAELLERCGLKLTTADGVLGEYTADRWKHHWYSHYFDKPEHQRWLRPYDLEMGVLDFERDYWLRAISPADVWLERYMQSGECGVPHFHDLLCWLLANHGQPRDRPVLLLHPRTHIDGQHGGDLIKYRHTIKPDGNITRENHLLRVEAGSRLVVVRRQNFLFERTQCVVG